MGNRNYLKIISVILAFIIVLSGCKIPSSNNSPSELDQLQEETIEVENSFFFERSSEEEEYVQKFKTLEEESL